VRRMVIQLPVEVLQQCSNASSCTCMRMRIVMEEHYTICQHSTFFNVLQYTSGVVMVPYCMFPYHHSFFALENSCHQLSDRQKTFKLFWLYWWNVCVCTALAALWFQHSQMKPRFHYLLLVQCNLVIHLHRCGIALKMSNPKPFS
jgi:hypothetical protein